MKDDIDNDKLDQFETSSDIDTPIIPGETEPDTTNSNDNESMPYSTDDTSNETTDESSDSTSSDMPDPISDYSPSNDTSSSDLDEDNSYDSSSSVMPDFVAPAPVANTKKTKHGKVIFGFIILVLLLALAGFVYWYYYMQPTTDNSTKPVATEPKANVDTGLSYTDVIKDLKSDMPGLVAESFPKAKTFTVDNLDAPALKIKDSDFYTRASGENQTVFVQTDGDKKYSFESDGIDTNKKYAAANKPINDAFVTYLTEKGFKEVQTADQDLPNIKTVYTNDATACSVSADEDPASVTCTELGNYSRDQATLAPMYSTLKKAEKEVGETTVLGLMSTKSNQALGYQNAVVSVSDAKSVVGGYAGLLYKKISDETWSYLGGAQDVLACGKYSTYAQQAAFQGDPCGDGKTVTVTADVPKKGIAL